MLEIPWKVYFDTATNAISVIKNWPTHEIDTWDKTVLIFNLKYLGDGRRQHVDSHNRLFGDVDRLVTPAKNHLKSNIPIGGEVVDGSMKHSNGGHYDQENGMNGNKNAGMYNLK